MEYQIKIIRSNRKSIGLEIKESGVLIIRAPYQASKSEIELIVHKHEAWIQQHMEKVAQKKEQAEHVMPFTTTEIRTMANEALKVIPPKVKYYAEILGVSYGRITIRNQKTRWGSCSAKGNLNFNCLLMEAPEEVLNYVIIHELCHRIEMNHSKNFWNLVESVMPDYQIQKQWLKENGGELIQRMIA